MKNNVILDEFNKYLSSIDITDPKEIGIAKAAFLSGAHMIWADIESAEERGYEETFDYFRDIERSFSEIIANIDSPLQ